MGKAGKYDVWRTVDALDFTVEHLSMYERLLQSEDALYEAFLERLRIYEQVSRRECPPSDKRTIGVMPYYAQRGSGHTRRESKALYLNITLRSVRCHFGAVAVSCLDPGDRQFLEEGRGLPVIDHVLWVGDMPKPSFLGIATIKRVQELNLWGYDYLFYTEADQVLHIRHRDKLFKCLNSKSILTPHRLNAVPRTDDFTDIPADGFVRREIDGYAAKPLTRVNNDLSNASCCYLTKGETAYPYNTRGKAAGVRVDDTVAGELNAKDTRPSPVELLALGDHGLAILAGLCCHICPRRGKLGRHCDNYCQPNADCARGRYSDPF